MVTLAGNPLSLFVAIRVFSRPNCPMLLVKTYLDKSRIHGLGVFAGEFIRKGTKIWRFVIGFDRYYSRKQLAKLPKHAKDFIKLHGYQWKNEILLSVDHDTFMNHSENPNTYYRNGYVIARCNIRKGAEITNDYRAFEAAFCAAFLKKPSRKRAKAAR
jgi:SET domain-containing protein